MSHTLFNSGTVIFLEVFNATVLLHTHTHTKTTKNKNNEKPTTINKSQSKHGTEQPSSLLLLFLQQSEAEDWSLLKFRKQKQKSSCC